MKVRLTMKVKLLFIFTVLTLFSIGTYLYFALDLFTKDKTASIYEASLNRVTSHRTQYASFIEEAYHKALLYASLIDLKQGTSESLVSKDMNILSLHRMEELEGAQENFYNDGVLSQHFDGIESSITNYKEQDLVSTLRPHVVRLAVEKYVVVDTRNLFTTPSLALVTKDPQGRLITTVVSLLGINGLIKKDTVFRNYLIDTNKSTISTSDGEKIGEAILTKIWNRKSKTVTEGTLEIEDENGDSYLASFSLHGPTDMLFISTINKDVAFYALGSLIKKSIVIAIVLIALSLMASVLVTSRLTNSLKRLVKGTKEIASGNYGLELNVTSSDEVAELTKSFNSMSGEISSLLSTKEAVIEQLEDAKTKLEAYSQNLADMVEERTNKLKETNDFMDTMLNSLGQGLMVFNRNGDIHDLYTTACDQIFRVSPDQNNITRVLELQTEDELRNFEKWLSNLFKELIPFEHLTDLGPRFWTNGLHEKDPNFKHVELVYHPMRGVDGKIENIVCVATDITGEYLAKKAFKEQEGYTAMITKVILGKGQFEVFINEFKLIMKDIVDKASHLPLELEILMRHFHTIKGGASLFSLQNLVDTAHVSESYIESHREGLVNGDKKAIAGLHEQVNNISRSFKELIFELRDYIGESLEDGQKRIEIKYPLMLHFKQKLIERNQFELAKAFQDNFLMEPVVRYFKGYNSMMQDLSKRLGKHINPIIFEDNGVQVYAEEFQEFFSVMVHVFRNIVDHGIESPKDRIAAGKSKAGNVLIRFSKTVFNNRDSLIVQIQDDGRGIEVSRVRETMKRMGYPEDKINEPDNVIVYHIFDENFSSNEVITDISGRGVGMSAIKQVIEKQGGAINVRTVEGKGVSFNFCINGTVSAPQARNS